MSKRIFPKILLVAVAVFGVLALSGVLSAQGLSHEAFERVKEVQERHTAHLLGIKGVEGTAIGFNQNNRPAVKVFVARWDVAGIPKKLDDVPVQVVVTGKFYALPKPEPPRPGEERRKGRYRSHCSIRPTGPDRGFNWPSRYHCRNDRVQGYR